MQDYLVLYALVRSDMASMRAGKGMAQCMHAQAMFDKFEIIVPLQHGREPRPMVMDWHNATPDGFGTTLTLSIPDLATGEAVVEAASALGFPAGFVIDPTYPYHVDNEVVSLINPFRHTLPPTSSGPGKTVCFREEKTVGYVFGKKSELTVLLDRFGLVPNT